MQINIKTKQYILDEIKSRKIIYFGKLNEIDFINRLVDLSLFSSNDPRCENMASDFCQHRINNPEDWDDYWFLSDTRINLINDDDLFKKFLCEFMHPSVRKIGEIKQLKEIINFYLKKDGYQLIEDEQYYEPDISTYKLIEINPTQIEKNFKTTDNFVHEAYEKIDKRLREEDYNGAVTSARSFLEYAIKDIYYQITGDNIEKIDNLTDGFKKIQKLLMLDYCKTADENIKIILRSFISIVSSFAPLFNNLGDRHASKTTAHRNSALFCTDSVKIFVNFIYGRMQNVYGLYPSMYDKIIKILDSELRLKNKKTILRDKTINNLFSKCDTYLATFLIKKHIDKYSIGSFRESDIFFSFLRIFSEYIKKNDLLNILEKNKHNNQAIGLELFIKYHYEQNNNIFTKDVMDLIFECKHISKDILG